MPASCIHKGFETVLRPLSQLRISLLPIVLIFRPLCVLREYKIQRVGELLAPAVIADSVTAAELRGSWCLSS